MRVVGGFVHGQHWGETGVRALQQFAPLCAGAGENHSRQFFTQRRPFTLFPLLLEMVIGDAEQRQQLAVELRLNGAYRDMFAVLARVRAVEVGRAIQEVAFA